MAKATDLPIYQAAYDLLIYITKIVGNFPRNRRILANKLLEDTHELVQCVFRSNSAKGSAKVPWIEKLQELLGSIRLSLRLSTDLSLITAGQHGNTVMMTTAVGKQANGWLTYAKGIA